MNLVLTKLGISTPTFDANLPSTATYRDVLSIDTDVVGKTFAVGLTQSNNTPERPHYWVFTDEMNFFGAVSGDKAGTSSSNDVPAPFGIAILGLLGLILSRSRNA